MKLDCYGIPYQGRTITEEIRFKWECFIEALPCYIPVASLAAVLIIASRL